MPTGGRSETAGTGPEDGIDRRMFLRSAAAGVAGLVIAPVAFAGGTAVAEDGLPAVRERRPFRAFEFDHEPEVQVLVKPARNPNRLRIRVRKDGRIVERHGGVHPRAIDRLQSEYFTVHYIEIPTA